MYVLKLNSTPDDQHQHGDEVQLMFDFIEYFYFQREFKADSHDRYVIIVKYGKDFFRIKEEGYNFIQWYKNTKNRII